VAWAALHNQYLNAGDPWYAIKQQYMFQLSFLCYKMYPVDIKRYLGFGCDVKIKVGCNGATVGRKGLHICMASYSVATLYL
jgi:hypothetical protein